MASRLVHFPTQFLSAGMWGQSQGERLLCTMGAKAFLDTVRAWSYLDGGSLSRARRSELVPIPAGRFPGPGNRWRVSLPWAVPLLSSPCRLPSQHSSSSRRYLFLRLECVGLVSLIASFCRLAKRILAAEMSLKLRRVSLAS